MLSSAIFLGSASGDDLIPDRDGDSLVLEREDELVQRPPMYKVLLLNDDYTPMEFVVFVLQRIFSMSVEQAINLMLAVHTRGVGVAGVFAYEIAETKVNQVLLLAREHGHPLQCQMEEED